MKKFLLLLAGVSACFSASAIELSFWLGNQKITPGQTVTFTEATVVTEETYKEVTMDPAFFLVSNIYSSDVKVTATCTSGQSIQLCAGGSCRGGVSVTKENVTVRPNQKLDLGFDYVGEFDLDEAVPTVVTLFEAEDVTEAGSKVQVVLEMSDGSASLSTITVADDFKAVEGGVAYKTDAAAALTVSNISGVTMFTGNVSGEGFVALPRGLYVYSFGDRKGKIFIK